MLFRKLSRDVDNALAEVQYALDVLLLDGVGLFTSAHGRYLGNPVLEPLMAELARRRVPVLVHPSVARRLEAQSQVRDLTKTLRDTAARCGLGSN